jgi:phage terminase large subunit-like protein
MGALEAMKNTKLSYAGVSLANREPYSCIIQSWDLAVTDNAEQAETNDTDYYVCTTVGILADRRRRVLDLERFRGLEAPQVLEKVDELYRRFRPDMVIVESNQFQRWFADYLLRFKHMPIYKNVTVGSDKSALKLKSSVLHVAIYAHLWEFPYATEDDQLVTELMWHELFYFGKERHDDIVMSMYFVEKTLGDVQQIIAENMAKLGTIQTATTADFIGEENEVKLTN